MLGAEGRDFLLFPLLNYGKGSYEGLYDMMSDPLLSRAWATEGRIRRSCVTRA